MYLIKYGCDQRFSQWADSQSEADSIVNTLIRHGLIHITIERY